MDFDFLDHLLREPSAPYRELHVLNLARRELTSAGVPFFADPAGNLIIGVSSQNEYRAKMERGGDPVRVFIAHTDHPGFHGVSWGKGETLEARWFGGAPVQKLLGCPMWLANAEGWAGSAKTKAVKLNKSKTTIATLTLVCEKGTREKYPEAAELYGAFKFRSPLFKKGKVWYTKAADDLVGSGVIISLAKALWKGEAPGKEDFIGVLTRAEEVGFIGAIAHFELGWLKTSNRPVVCVSLETSRTLPGALVGKGPVVRLGDRATTFDAGATELLSDLAKNKLPKKYQRRIMDGGTCEGTVATAFGFTTLALSVPLGNYHNQSFEGGPDSRGKLGPAPEFVHKDDVLGMYVLCRELMAPNLKWKTPWNERVEGFLKSRKEAQALLDHILT